MSEVAHDNWKRLKLFEETGMIDWLIDWLVYNDNFNSISGMSWSKQILYTKFLGYPISQLQNP